MLRASRYICVTTGDTIGGLTPDVMPRIRTILLQSDHRAGTDVLGCGSPTGTEASTAYFMLSMLSITPGNWLYPVEMV